MIDRERVEYWVGKGAQLSDTVRQLVARPRRQAETMTAAADDLLSVVRLLVDDPRSVAVEEIATTAGTSPASELRLSVSEADRGKVIGRRGRTIDALRALMRVRGEREGRAHDLELVED